MSSLAARRFTYDRINKSTFQGRGYPSGRTVNYVLDTQGNQADTLGLTDRIVQVQDQGNQSIYAQLSYLAPGQVSAEMLGNGVLENLAWNDRLQQTGLSVGSGNLLALNFYPCNVNGVYGTVWPSGRNSAWIYSSVFHAGLILRVSSIKS